MGWVSLLRNLAFRWGIYQRHRFDLPVISVGNLSVGGTGKTPHVEYLVQLCKQQQKKVAVLSRGYGRKTKGFLLVTKDLTARECGDEPWQIKSKFPDIIVAVDEKRAHGIETLQTQFPELEIVILDDAFQHRFVKPSLSILLTDARHPFYEDFLMPVGRLREPRSFRKKADMIIITKTPSDWGEARKYKMVQAMRPIKEQQVYFSGWQYGSPFQLDNPNNTLTAMDRGATIHLLTAIANTKDLEAFLSQDERKVVPHTYRDHHYFTNQDMDELKSQFAKDTSSTKIIITTEKDATKLERWKEDPELPVYVLPIVAQFHEKEKFDGEIIKSINR